MVSNRGMIRAAKQLVQTCLTACAVIALGADAAPSKDIKGGGLFFYDPVNVFQEGALLPGLENYEPSLARVGDVTWLAMLEFTPGEGDQIVTGVLDKDFQFTQRRVVTETHGKYRRPTLAVDGPGRLWLSYEAFAGDRWGEKEKESVPNGA